MSARGEIRNRARKRQIIDMRGMAIGTITPTDLDGFIDFHNERFALFELKLAGMPMERGQSLAFTRLVDVIEKSGKRAALFVAEHDVDDPAVDIEAHRCVVREVYTLARWYTPKRALILVEAVNRFLGFNSLPDGEIVGGCAEEVVSAVVPVDKVAPPHVDEIFK